MDRIGIEFITGHGMDPVAFVHLAADLGVSRIGLALSPILLVPESALRWSMRDDAALHRAVKTALSERSVSVMLGEGFLIRPSVEIADSAHDLDLLAELGAERANMVSIDPDTMRAHDQFAHFAAMASERGMRPTIEYMPAMPIGTLAAAFACVEASGNGDAGVLIDAMHFFRSGGTIAELQAFDPARIGHVQICDVPWESAFASYGEEAKCERLAPGDGDLPLAEFIAALPRDLPLGIEVPQQSRDLAGVDPHERVSTVVVATRTFTTGLL